MPFIRLSSIGIRASRFLDDLDRNLASLSNGHIEYLVTRHIPLQSFQALTAFAECVIKGTKPQRRNNYVHMDILHRRNLDNY